MDDYAELTPDLRTAVTDFLEPEDVSEELFNLVRAGMAIVSAAQQNNIPLDPDQFKNMAVGKNQFMRQKNALWYDMLSCGVALARSGF